nr:major facilitator transporter [uncultured bacterium]
MAGTLRSLRSLLLSVAVLLAGHGLQLTLLPLKAQDLGWSSGLIGFTGSAYYLGFILGCIYVPALIRRVGHARVYAAAVALAVSALLLASILEQLSSWLVLRALTGWSLACLYTVIESWLNEAVDNARRGTVMAIYTIISLGAMAIGQLFVDVDGVTFDDLFVVGALLIVVATVPISLTRTSQPAPPAEIAFDWRAVWSASSVGSVCAGLSGMVMGLLWSLGAVHASEVLGDPGAGARFVMAAVIGGLLAQFPVGRASDLFDRRWTILLLAGVGLVGAALSWILPVTKGQLYIAAFLCGAAAMPMYSISVAHANDNARGRFLQIASGMLLANAVGAVLGPLIFNVTLTLGWDNGFMGIIAAAFACCLVWTLLRLRVHEVSRDYFEPFQPLPKTTPEIVNLDPRLEDERDEHFGEKAVRDY